MGPHVVAFSSDREWMDAFNPGLADRAADPDNRTNGRDVLRPLIHMLDQAVFQRDTAFLCTEEPTIAETAAYQELGQLAIAKLWDFDGFPAFNDGSRR